MLVGRDYRDMTQITPCFRLSPVCAVLSLLNSLSEDGSGGSVLPLPPGEGAGVSPLSPGLHTAMVMHDIELTPPPDPHDTLRIPYPK